MSREQEITFGVHNACGSISGRVVAYYTPCIDHDTGETYGQLNWWRSVGPLHMVTRDGGTMTVEPADLSPEVLDDILWIINSSLN